MSKRPKIKVKNSGYVDFKAFDDGDRGVLYATESLRWKSSKLKSQSSPNHPLILDSPDGRPFTVNRIFFITNVKDPEAQRANHGHRKFREVIFCLRGSFTIFLDDGQHKQKIVMNRVGEGLLVGDHLWHQVTHFSSDSVLLAVADGPTYDKDAYVHDYDEFLKLVKAKKSKKK